MAVASLCCDTLMTSQEHSNGASILFRVEHLAVSMMELAVFVLSPQVRHGRVAASLLALWASSVCVKGLHDDHFHPLESSDN